MARGRLTRSPSGHLTRQTGRSPDSPSGSTFTLADGLADFLVSGRARGLSPKALAAMSVAEARAFVVSLQEAGLAPSSVAGFVRGLRAFSAWCAAEGLVAEDPLRRLPRPRVPSRLIATLGLIACLRRRSWAARLDPIRVVDDRYGVRQSIGGRRPNHGWAAGPRTAWVAAGAPSPREETRGDGCRCLGLRRAPEHASGDG